MAIRAEFFYGSDGETHYEMEWDFAIQDPRGNHNGISGFARVLRSSGSSPSAAHVGRVHLCSVKPCAADFPSSKYRTGIAPWHLQPSAWRPAASAVAEAAAAPEAEPGSLPHPPEFDGPARAMGGGVLARLNATASQPQLRCLLARPRATERERERETRPRAT